MPFPIHLLDLIERNKLEEILKVFTDVTGVAAIITDVDGQPLTKAHNFTGLCRKFSRSTPEGQKKCYQSDSYGGRETARRAKGVIYKCWNAGLLDSGAPIIVEGRHLANILCGQVLEKPMDEREAVRRAKSIGIQNIEDYLAEMHKIPIMNRKQLRRVVNLMEMITQTISEIALQKYRLNKHSQRFLNKLVNSVSDGIVATSSDLSILRVNKALKRMFGYDEDQLIHGTLPLLLFDEKSQELLNRYLYSGNKTNFRAELTAIDAAQDVLPVQISMSKIRSENEEDSGYVAVIRDISEEKRVAQMKEDLIGMLTHDLQNPVLSIQKAIQLMVSGSLGELNQHQMDVMNLALGTSQQAFGMVMDFLDVYRDENGQFRLRRLPIDLNKILEDAITQVKIFSLEKEIAICTELSSTSLLFEGDRNRLLRTFVNIIDNAVKFSPGSTKITIRSVHLNGFDQTQNEVLIGLKNASLHAGTSYAVVTITDQGLGIPKKKQEHVFDKFFTSKSRSGGDRKGLGLGLAFCKLAVEAHRGLIWIESPLEGTDGPMPQGCRFYVALPMTQEE